MAAVAGCGGETEFEEGNENGDSGDGSSEPENSIEILEHELVREDAGGPAESVSVEGRAENVSDRQLSYAEVRARFYNEQGDQIESSLDNINDVDPGQTWAFDIIYPGIGDDAADVVDYDIGVGTEL